MNIILIICSVSRTMIRYEIWFIFVQNRILSLIDPNNCIAKFALRTNGNAIMPNKKREAMGFVTFNMCRLNFYFICGS